MSKPRRSVGLVYDSEMEAHKGPINHPERPERTQAIMAKLLEEGLSYQCTQITARIATDTEINAIHPNTHVGRIEGTAHGSPLYTEEEQAASGGGGGGTLTDTYTCPASAKAARLAAGSTIELCAAVAEGVVGSGMAVVRPPGHHCGACSPMGFCLYNNVAVAVRAVQGGLSKCGRVLVFDWDVHHGNGTQAIFENDASVLYVSLHAYFGGKTFPYSGAATEVGVGEGEGFNVNVPFGKVGLGDADYMYVLERVVMPIATNFNPDIVIVSAGFDAAEGDPIGKMRVTPEGYAAMLRRLLTLANGKVALVLEGGYNTAATAYSVEACVRTLLGLHVDPSASEGADPHPTTVAIVETVLEIQRKFWPGFVKNGEKYFCGFFCTNKYF